MFLAFLAAPVLALFIPQEASATSLAQFPTTCTVAAMGVVVEFIPEPGHFNKRRIRALMTDAKGVITQMEGDLIDLDTNGNDFIATGHPEHMIQISFLFSDTGQVSANKSSPGADGMTGSKGPEFPATCVNVETLRAALIPKR